MGLGKGRFLLTPCVCTVMLTESITSYLYAHTCIHTNPAGFSVQVPIATTDSMATNVFT